MHKYKESGAMPMINIVIVGNPATKKNSSRIVKWGQRYSLIPNANYKAYESDFISQCIKTKVNGKSLDMPLNIACKYYMKTKRKVDLTNLLSATMDCLVKAKVIKDDNCTIAVSHDGSRVYYDKNDPRVEIEISEVKQ